MITMQSWMFLSSFEKFRAEVLSKKSIITMAHLGARAFDSIGGEVVSTTAFVIENEYKPERNGCFLRLVAGKSEFEKELALRDAIKNRNGRMKYFASSQDLKKIPGSPIAYWASNNFRNLFQQKSTVNGDDGNKTGDTGSLLRFSWETSRNDSKWVNYTKGGTFRRWFGNREHLIRFDEEALNYMQKNPTSRLLPERLRFKKGITWTKVTTTPASFRILEGIELFDTGAPAAFVDESVLKLHLGFLNSCVSKAILGFISPTMNYTVGSVTSIPVARKAEEVGSLNVPSLLKLSRRDWDSFENSWDFTSQPLLNPDYRQPTLKATYQKLRAHWREMTLEMQQLEEENNRIFIEAYGLQDELTPEVPLNEITLTCNPHYRYGNDKSEDELEALLLADTMRELVSYAVGCMFGRYALDKPGLILANQGETIEDYLKRVPEPSFPADDDNVIPMLDGDWFTDDIAERFRKFLRVAFGDEHYEANLQFVEKALNIKGKRNYSIRDYFLGEFYTDHVKRYKKRPIYWLFSSPKGSFNALIYMHRYRPDTVSVVLNDYLREFRTKLTSHKSHLEAVSISAGASAGEKTKALKEIDKINKMIVELEDYEREVLYPLATEQVEIDLDDGVKANYPKFGAALKKIVGLEAKED